MSKPKLLSEHDVQEVVQFQRYLGDIGKIPPRDFVSKYKEYMGLTEEEAEAYVLREEKAGALGDTKEKARTKKNSLKLKR